MTAKTVSLPPNYGLERAENDKVPPINRPVASARAKLSAQGAPD